MDPVSWAVIGAFALCLAVAAALIWRPARSARRASELEHARRAFHLQREHLEHRFFELAAASGKPRGLRWVDCEFDDEVSYARDRGTGELRAFVSVAISFEAVEGGPMEGVEAVHNVRAATAVFRHGAAHWHTDGRAIFNLNPSETIDYYRESLQRIVEQQPRRA